MRSGPVDSQLTRHPALYPDLGIDDRRGAAEIARGVTYDEARRWLKKIGGTWTEAKEPQPPHIRPSVIVTVKSAKGETVQRHALYDGALEGWEREIEIRRAFVRACEELKAALA